MKKFINANIYRNEDATEILVEKGASVTSKQKLAIIG